MKTEFLKYGLLLIAVIVANAVKAQDKTVAKTHSSYDIVNNKTPGKLKESVNSYSDGKDYRFTLINGKLSELFVDEVKIPADKYGDYADAIGKIREQIRKDKIQAEKDQVQARIDQKQAMRDQMQAKRDQQQAAKEQQQAKLDEEQAQKDQMQAKRDQEQAEKDQEQARIDQKQAEKDQEQAKLDQEQAGRDQAQAKIDEEQAREDQKLMAAMINDLVKDGIIANEKSLYSVSLDENGMTVNDKKQPDQVFARYKEKYKRFAGGNFTYENNQNGSTGIHMSRRKQ